MGLGWPGNGTLVLSAAGGGFRELGWAGDKFLPKVTLAFLYFCFMMCFSLLCSLHFSSQPMLEAPFLQEAGGHGEHLFIDRNTKWSMNISG